MPIQQRPVFRATTQHDASAAVQRPAEPIGPPLQGGTASLVVGFAGAWAAIALLFAFLSQHDREALGVLDTILADAPSDVTRPFGATALESSLLARYREPAPSGQTDLDRASKNHVALPSGLTEAVLSKASRFYGLRCASCHGMNGDGNGLAAEMINPKPRNYKDRTWQLAVSDEDLVKAIVKGGRAVGKSYMMPAAVDLEKKPEMVTALVYMIRSFGAQ